MANFYPTDTTANVQTTNATPTTLAEVSLPEDCTAIVTVTAVARKTTGGTSKTWVKNFTVKRPGASAPQILGTIQNLISPVGDLGALTWDLEFSDDGDAVLVQAKGQASTTIEWYCRVSGLTIEDA